MCVSGCALFRFVLFCFDSSSNRCWGIALYQTDSFRLQMAAVAICPGVADALEQCMEHFGTKESNAAPPAKAKVADYSGNVYSSKPVHQHNSLQLAMAPVRPL
mmetsp:Transcript_24474/g.53610  ORF Transcript_24474/g.53610 Transcript_24474/m.53610 type:complete len:103 (-) Transcript_24474:33-341(-)